MKPRPATVMLALVTIVALTLPLAAWAGETAKTSDEHAAIEVAARDYIDGWYEGDAVRMARALHPDLAKRNLNPLPNGRQIVRSLTRDTMIAFTEAGFGKESKREGQVNEVTILDVSPVTASVKTVSHQFVDYLHLAKVDGTWKIVNVLWEPAPQESKDQ